jgi:hypothetical protein
VGQHRCTGAAWRQESLPDNPAIATTLKAGNLSGVAPWYTRKAQSSGWRCSEASCAVNDFSGWQCNLITVLTGIADQRDRSRIKPLGVWMTSRSAPLGPRAMPIASAPASVTTFRNCWTFDIAASHPHCAPPPQRRHCLRCQILTHCRSDVFMLTHRPGCPRVSRAALSKPKPDRPRRPDPPAHRPPEHVRLARRKAKRAAISNSFLKRRWR